MANHSVEVGAVMESSKDHSGISMLVTPTRDYMYEIYTTDLDTVEVSGEQQTLPVQETNKLNRLIQTYYNYII